MYISVCQAESDWDLDQLMQSLSATQSGHATGVGRDATVSRAVQSAKDGSLVREA